MPLLGSRQDGLRAPGARCRAAPPQHSSCPQVRQSLQETVRSFKVTNEELAARGPGSEQDVAACDAACKVSAGLGSLCRGG